jgi:hypothetical protein
VKVIPLKREFYLSKPAFGSYGHVSSGMDPNAGKYRPFIHFFFRKFFCYSSHFSRAGGLLRLHLQNRRVERTVQRGHPNIR